MISKKIRNAVKRDYETTKASVADVSKRYGVNYKTVHGWVKRYHWNKNLKKDSRTDLAVHGLMNDGLSLATNKFIMYYLNSFNGRLSYHKVHPKAKWNTCEVNASQLLSNTKVQNIMQSIKDRQFSGMLISNHDLLHQYAKRAFSNITDVVDVGTKVGTNDHGQRYRYNYLYLKDSDDADYSNVESIKKGRDGSISVKMPNRDHALDVLLENVPKSKGGVNHATMMRSYKNWIRANALSNECDEMKKKLLQARTRKENAEAKIKSIEAKNASHDNNTQAKQMERVLEAFEIPDPDSEEENLIKDSNLNDLPDPRKS